MGKNNDRSTRREFLGKAGAVALSLPFVAGLTGASAGAATKRRNIIFILTDDQRYDAMSCMGHPFLETPNLDRLVSGGVLLKNAFVTTSLCSPSRATILTGRYAHRTGVTDNSTAFPEGTTTFPMILKEAGYETAFIGKWHMRDLSDYDMPQPGFDRWVSFPSQGVYFNPRFNIDGEREQKKGYTTDLLTDYAVEFLKRPRTKPFCLYLAHKAVHASFEPAPRHRDKYADVPVVPPPSMADTEENYRGRPAWVRAQRNSWHGVDGMYNRRMSYDQFIRNYNRTVLAIDDSVGRVLDTLKETGILDSTLVIFTSDNGFLQGEHGLIDKRCMYEESLRVPMLAHCPEIAPAKQRVEKMVLNVDIAPTILDAAGVPIPNTMDGSSFLPLLRGENVPWRQSFLYEYFWEQMFPQTPTVFGVRTETHKYMWYHGIWDKNEVYDLKDDPHEMTNLIDDPASSALRKELESELARLMNELSVSRVPSWSRQSL